MSYLGAFRKYGVFSGRATRTEFWSFAAIHLPIILALDYLNLRIGGWAFTVLMVYGAGSFLPTLAILARRLHDTDKSGWLSLVWFLPLGFIVVLVLAGSAGTVGPNKYGPDPKNPFPFDPANPYAMGGHQWNPYAPAPMPTALPRPEPLPPVPSPWDRRLREPRQPRRFRKE